MSELFGVDIAEEIFTAMDGQLLPAVLTKVTESARDPNNLSGGPALTTTDYAAQGFWEDYETKDIDGTIVHQDDRKALIIANSIADGAKPEKGDKITITEDDGTSETAEILRLQRDPATATFTLHCGKR